MQFRSLGYAITATSGVPLSQQINHLVFALTQSLNKSTLTKQKGMRNSHSKLTKIVIHLQCVFI